MVVKSPRKQIIFDLLLAVFLLVLSALLSYFQIMQRWDNLYYDLESVFIEQATDDSIVIVAIDDYSLKKLGRWPWSRDSHARLIDQLTTAGAAAVAMDILFMEPDLMHPEYDRQLAAAIHRNGRVVLPVLTREQNNTILVTKPLPEIAAAAHLAHVNMHFDSQGVVRKLDLQLELSNGQNLPAMSLALNRQLDSYVEPADLDTRGQTLIAFAGPAGHFRQISYADVLLDNSVRQSLQGKVVLIGMTAAGLGSNIATPVSKSSRLMSGIEFQANAVAAIKSGSIIQTLARPACALLSLLLIVIPIMLYRFLKPGRAMLLALGFIVLTGASSFYLLSILQLWFAPLPTILGLILSYPLWSLRKLEQLRRSLFKEHERASATLMAIMDAVITTDSQGHIEFMNPAAEKMLACTLTEARNKPLAEICKILDKNESTLLDSRTLISKEQLSQTQIICNRNKQEYAVRVSVSSINTEKGQLAGYVYALSDLTELIISNQKIAFIAAHDALTGLPNRVLLQDRLEQAISSASQGHLSFAILFIDLDDFKKINEGIGHAFGDLLLQEVAGRLQHWVKPSDTISRWGGDEFIILLDNVAPSDAADIAIKMIQSLSQSFMLNKQEVFVTLSIGISLFPEDGQQAEMLLAKADAAMDSVKKNSRDDFCFYSQDLQLLAKERLVLETELHQALQAGEFEMHYQPQIDLVTHQITGVEALIRWRHPIRGLVSPNNFIPLAEETGLIVPIGEWIIKTVCQQIEIWRQQDLPRISVAINLSARQFEQKNLASVFIQEINRCGISADLLQVEITESMMLQNIDRVIQILDDLKCAGISIAVDDFGTGYSSLENLKRLPIDKLKIDRSFVDSVLKNEDDANIIQAVIALGHNMNMQIIAEGVETEEQLKFLQQCQCDYGQGYLFSKPIPAQEIGQYIKQLEKLEQA